MLAWEKDGRAGAEPPAWLVERGPAAPGEELEKIGGRWTWIHPRGHCRQCDVLRVHLEREVAR